MKIYGGEAMQNGVMFDAEEFSATAIRKRDGSIYIERATYEESLGNTFLKTLSEIPFIRGIAFVINLGLGGGYWKKSLVFSIIAASIVWIVTTIIGYIFPDVGELLYSENDITTVYPYIRPVLLGLIIAGAIIFRITPITRYHGAEHKVYNAFLNGKPLIIDNVRAESCINDDCGTNVITNLIVFLIIGDLISLPLVVNILLSCSLGYEAAKTSNHILHKIVYPFTLIGRLVQAAVMTREPSDKEIEVAISAFLNCITDGPIIFYNEYENFRRNNAIPFPSESIEYEDPVTG